MPSNQSSGSPSADPFNLERFVAAQLGTFEVACRELVAGRKTSHWMWFVFPQMRGLGLSEMSQFYGIASLAEAAAYLAHPLLGPRLRRAAALLLAIEPGPIEDILGSPDDMKLRSSMTLFAMAAADQIGEDNKVFLAVLERYFDGEKDEATLKLIGLEA